MSSPVLNRYSSSDEKVDVEKSAGAENIAPVEQEFDDPNLDKDAIVLEDDSPYPEVRASVSNTDDPAMPAMTFRSWFVGIVLCILASGLNIFFNFRYPAPYIAPLILL